MELSADETRQFAELVTRRRDVMVRILKVSMDQERAVLDGMVEALVARLNDKEHLVNELRTIQKSLKPSAEIHPDQRNWASEEARGQCRQELNDTEKLQAAILEIDTRCEKAMIERKDELFASLNKTNGAATAAKAYGAKPVRGGGSFDASSS
jgi:small-conductance mechanosensitive channel